MTDIYLFNYSFIEHLRRYVLKDRSPDNLGLDPMDFNVHFHGHGSLSLLQLERLADCVAWRGASMVFLGIRTNDLGHPDRDPERLARDI